MFGRATMTLGIGPHSSFNMFSQVSRKLWQVTVSLTSWQYVHWSVQEHQPVTLLMYYDEPDQWPAVYKSSLVCLLHCIVNAIQCSKKFNYQPSEQGQCFNINSLTDRHFFKLFEICVVYVRLCEIMDGMLYLLGEEGTWWGSNPSSLLFAVPAVRMHPSGASVPIIIYGRPME